VTRAEVAGIILDGILIAEGTMIFLALFVSVFVARIPV